MLGSKAGKQIFTYVPDYVVFDLETTGISRRSDEVIEISAVKVRKGSVVEEFSELVKPARPIPRAATMVNNISNDMVADADDFCEVLPRFLDFIGNDILVGHNIHSFDMKFMYRDCMRYFSRTLTNDYADTLSIARLVFPDWHHRRLGDLADYYGISTLGAHRALADCRMNQKIFELLGMEMRGEGTLDIRPEIRICPDCGSPLKKRKGKFGEFWGCSSYPRCRHTEKI